MALSIHDEDDAMPESLVLGADVLKAAVLDASDVQVPLLEIYLVPSQCDQL